MSIAEIKNTHLRRAVLVAAAPVFVLLAIAIGSVTGAVTVSGRMLDALGDAWRGQE